MKRLLVSVLATVGLISCGDDDSSKKPSAQNLETVTVYSESEDGKVFSKITLSAGKGAGVKEKLTQDAEALAVSNNGKLHRKLPESTSFDHDATKDTVNNVIAKPATAKLSYGAQFKCIETKEVTIEEFRVVNNAPVSLVYSSVVEQQHKPVLFADITEADEEAANEGKVGEAELKGEALDNAAYDIAVVRMGQGFKTECEGAAVKTGKTFVDVNNVIPAAPQAEEQN